jgi:hypothetical protein
MFPDTVGVPLIVMVFEANAAVTPAGNPVAVLFPLLQLLWVISVNTVLHNVGVVLAALAVLFGVTVIVPVAFTRHIHLSVEYYS